VPERTAPALIEGPVLTLTRPDPEAMSPRARGYLATAAVQWLVIGFSLLLQPETFGGPAFIEVFRVAPRPFWIVALIAGGVHLTYCCLSGSEAHSRTALVFSAVIGFMWATALGYAIDAGHASIFAVSVLVGCGLRDLIACAQPLRSPFERLAFLLPEEQRPATDR
jgi:hypothetical protein